MYMSFPNVHKARYENFKIDGILDETLREGSERCMFSVSPSRKTPLVKSILNCGIKDIVFGSGPEDPKNISDTIINLISEKEISDQKLSFILLLNCFKPLMKQFQSIPEEAKKHITISFGMITHDSENSLFERTVENFRSLGFNSFRVSLLNKFSGNIDHETYENITKQINRSINLGIETVRINDSLGTIYPEAMSILAANLRNDYPSTNFCLHAHNDRGLGLQNALASIYNGFNYIEGGFAEFGNRSGLPSIELLSQIFQEKNIGIASGNISTEQAIKTAQLAEEVFLVMPSLFRPLSGRIVNCENMGVANIPDYLGQRTAAKQFLNETGLHYETIENMVRDSETSPRATSKDKVEKISKKLREIMRDSTESKTIEYKIIRGLIEQFYDKDVIFSDRAIEIAKRTLINEIEEKIPEENTMI